MNTDFRNREFDQASVLSELQELNGFTPGEGALVDSIDFDYLTSVVEITLRLPIDKADADRILAHALTS